MYGRYRLPAPVSVGLIKAMIAQTFSLIDDVPQLLRQWRRVVVGWEMQKGDFSL